jgi:formate/nitrite transporter FocA (FNT family)
MLWWNNVEKRKRKRMSMKKLNDFLMAVLAGAAISIGGTVFLSLDNKVLGALFFCLGLFMVCTLGLNLYTGKVCYVPGKGWDYVGFVGLVWLGNLVGAEIVALLLKLTRVGAALTAKAAALCEVKTGDSLISLFVLGIFCNIMINKFQFFFVLIQFVHTFKLLLFSCLIKTA